LAFEARRLIYASKLPDITESLKSASSWIFQKKSIFKNFFKKEIITFEEKNSTYRAKERYFELFPNIGLKLLIPREFFILNKNLDAISALIILEDYCKMKFSLNQNIDFKTWRK